MSKRTLAVLLAVAVAGCAGAATSSTTPTATETERASVEWSAENDTDATAHVTATIDYGAARYLVAEDDSSSRLWSSESDIEPNTNRFVASYGDSLTVWAMYPESEETELVGKWKLTRDGIKRADTGGGSDDNAN